jgi:hypothetical protein
MSGLPWVRLDTNLPQHDKILAVLGEKEGHRTAFVYVCGLAYSGANGTDGAIPFGALPFIHARQADAHRLVKAGLWAPIPNGWQIVNWALRQQSSGTTGAIRAAQSLGAQKANCARWHGPDCGCWETAGVA